MARNPYAGLGTARDPYTNGYATSDAPPSTADDYDPYGERYNTPPIPSTSAARDRKGTRTGGYGGFENNNESVVTPQQIPQPTPPDGQSAYGSRPIEDLPPTRSPRRERLAAVEPGPGRRYREERSQGGSADNGRSRNAEPRRPAERFNPRGIGSSGGDPTVGRSRPNGRNIGVGDGTRQIEGTLP